MKRLIVVICLLASLSGCQQSEHELDRALLLRNKTVSANQCSFFASISAEYDNEVYTFDLICKEEKDNDMSFAVIKPDTITGISGTIDESSGKLTFDDEILAFELMIDNRLSPISAPWLMLHLLKSGYIAACGKEGDGIHIQLEDTYAGEKVLIDLYTDNENNPIRADILWKGQRRLSIIVKEYSVV